MKKVFEVAILAVIQGITEFFPISSSGHLAVIQSLWGRGEMNLALDAVLHLGSFLAIIIYFGKTWKKIFLSLIFPRKFPEERKLVFYLFLATLPALIGGIFLEGVVSSFFQKEFFIAIFLLITAVILFLAEILPPRTKPGISWWEALAVGVSQIFALFPGISRSGITLSTAIFLNLNREKAARFSFLLAAPIILGAGMMGLYEFDKVNGKITWDLFLGLFLAFVVSFFAIKYFLTIIAKFPLYYFSLYLILIATLIFVFL